MTDNILISVVVCTYNRVDLLKQVLETLCVQAVDPATYEIIVVDNNSTDTTREAVAEFERKVDNVRYILETNVGLSHARNRGWQEAHGEYVAYTDDDCKVPPEWLAVAQEIMQTVAPAVFGGPFYAFYNTPKPAWYKDRYGSMVQGQIARRLREDEYNYGGNLFIARKLFEQIGGFRADLGMTGNTVAYGEETTFIDYIRKNLPDEIVYYDPRLYTYHLVRPEKMTFPWLIRQHFALGRDVRRAAGPNSAITGGWRAAAPKALPYAFLLAAEALFGLLLRDRDRHPYAENYWFERCLRYFVKLGDIYEGVQMNRRTPKSESVAVVQEQSS